MASPQLEVLVKYRADLESSLLGADLFKLCRNLYKNKVMPKNACDRFTSLDPDQDHLEAEVKVRYLLKLVIEGIRENSNAYDRLIKVLSRLGGETRALCNAMGREVDIATDGLDSIRSVKSTKLVEQDVPHLVEILVSGSHLWDAIGIALNLPKHKRVDCGKEEEGSVSKLSNILTTWISYEGGRPANLSNLREALSSETVGLGKLAEKLMMYEEFEASLPKMTKTSLNLDISYQSGDINVTEDTSTLLEVQVSCTESESYQWSKDGKTLLDGADFSGVCSNILYINRASQCIEGKYSCCVSRDCETVCSDEMSLSIIYPPEKKKLLEFYSVTEKEIPQDFWPPVGNSTFINLVLITQKPMSTCDYYTIRGDMDDILRSKEVAEYEKVFREYTEGALILIEGRPGCGKTTLVHKLTRDWANGMNVLQGAKLVFLVTLRLLNASWKDKNLMDILQLYFYNEKFSKQIEHTLTSCGGKGACFILDGLDEYPIKSKKNLVIDQLLFTKTFLPHSMVIVASRPVATKELRTKCNTRIEVVGFSKDQIYSYVRSYPFDECSASMVSKMTEFLCQHSNVLHMCYLPIHAAIICFLFSQLEGKIPHRETQIYEQFTIATLLKHKAHKGEELQLKSLGDLDGEEKKMFKSVCELAFNMIVNSQQVLSKSETKVGLNLDFAVGLITVERTSKYYGSEDFYTFSHLTLQEFLAAYYLHEAKKKDEKLIRKDSFKNVWKFYSGLSTSNPSISFVKKIINKCSDLSDKVQLAYESQQIDLCDYCVRNNEAVLVYGFFTITDLIALGYVISKTTKLLNKIVWGPIRYDCEGVKLFVSMATDEKLLSIKRLTVLIRCDESFKALNYLLLHLPFLEQLDMPNGRWNKSSIKYLSSEVTLPHLKLLKLCIPLAPPCSHPGIHLKQLTFNSKSMSKVFYEVQESPEVNHVMWNKILRYVFCCQTSHMSWLHLYNIDNYPSLPREKLSHCTEVILVNCCIGDEGAEILASTLNTSILENLVLDFNRIRDSGAVALAGCLARCSVVQEVSIQCNCIGDSGATALADALVHCSSLRRLDLQGNSLGDIGAIAIAKATEGLLGLDLYLYNVNISEEGVERLLEYRARTRIRSMEFTSSWNSVSEENIDTLRRALYSGYLPALRLSSSNICIIEKLVTEQESVMHVRGIECIRIISEDTVPTLCFIISHMSGLHYIKIVCESNISSTSAQHLSDCLKTCKSLHSLVLQGSVSEIIPNMFLDVVRYCSQLRSLSLLWCDIYGVNLLCRNHKSWINLHTLKLDFCSLGPDEAQVLSRIFTKCKKLCSLNLSGNNIGDSGALAIAEGLKGHSGLRELSVGIYDITLEGMTALSQVIKCNHLQHLNLSYSWIAEYVPIFVDVMCQDSLQILELRSIDLNEEGAAILGDGLKKCTQLVKLNLRDNKIRSHGVIRLSEGLQHCTNLQDLDLSKNQVTSDGVTGLYNVMASCKYLRRLDLSYNIHIGVDGVASLINEWKHKSVLSLCIEGCIDDSHKSALAKGERCCCSCDHLSELYYNNNYVYIPTKPKLVSIRTEI